MSTKKNDLALIRSKWLPQLSPAYFIHFRISPFSIKLFYGFICTCALLYGSVEFWLVPHAGSDTIGRSMCLTTSNWQGDLQQDLWMKPMERDNRSVPEELPPEQPKCTHTLSPLPRQQTTPVMNLSAVIADIYIYQPSLYIEYSCCTISMQLNWSVLWPY